MFLFDCKCIVCVFNIKLIGIFSGSCVQFLHVHVPHESMTLMVFCGGGGGLGLNLTLDEAVCSFVCLLRRGKPADYLYYT